ncbi:MAG: 1-acyl-sn-glycerol-3-phosphate acyltransferase [Bacteroidales bacterium]|nr:1-acyl-sn-glycerol-3-phosphate acyltransferase [Bacteroidales bacterium]
MNQEPMTIDIRATVKQRLPRHYRFIPGFAIRWVERLVHQRELNEILHRMHGKDAVSAAQEALDYLSITTEVVAPHGLPADGRFIFVSNHPLGGLDGLSLISVLGKHYGGAIRFLVNDLLMAVKPLQPVFLPVNKYGRQSRERAAEIEAQYQGDNQMITFPAGLCSRMGNDGEVHDLQWQKFVVTQAVRTQRHIVPIFFEGENSRLFYRMARLRKRLGMKFNLEMLLLPGEMFKSKGSRFRIVVGKPIAWQQLDAQHPLDEAQRLASTCYALKPTDK